MFIYYARQFNASFTGIRMVPVCCEQCRSDYFYELARVGTGSASAPYGIGSKGAAERAEKQAKEELQRRLVEESELVPCPRCHWINQEMIAGYRKARYRGWGKFAGGLAVIGTSISVLIGLVLSNGPAVDRDARNFFLVVGPVVSLGLAGLLLLARNWLRSLINPNRDFPEPPRKLPSGSPAALIKNPTTGELEPVRAKAENSVWDGELDDFPLDRAGSPVKAWVDFQVGRSTLPPACTSCLAPSNPQSADRRSLFPAVDLVLPRCASCARRRKQTMWKSFLITLVATMAVAIPVMKLLNVDEIVFWVCIAGLGSVFPLMGIMIGDRLTSPVQVKLLDKSRAIVRLRFRNEHYRKLIQMYDGGQA
jgi:hypothetical protein